MYRWLGMFRAKAPPKSTDAYRTAAEVVLDELTIAIPADDDVEAPPVAVRSYDPTLGPETIPMPWGVRTILVASLALVIVIMMMGWRAHP